VAQAAAVSVAGVAVVVVAAADEAVPAADAVAPVVAAADRVAADVDAAAPVAAAASAAAIVAVTVVGRDGPLAAATSGRARAAISSRT
jgi:hypothetical protein